MQRLTLTRMLDGLAPENRGSLLGPLLGGATDLKLRETRLQPPVCLWATFRPAAADGQWATFKGFFDLATFDDYVAQLEAHYPEQVGRPDHPRGGIVLHPPLNAVLWAFPFDPSLPGLPACVDGGWAAGVLRRRHPVVARPRQYRAEVGAQIAYATPSQERVVAFGKVLPSATIGVIHAATRRLWASQARQSGVLRIPRPLAYRPTHGLLMQAVAPGSTIGRDRNRALFLQLVEHAGAALAGIHAANIPFGDERLLSHIQARLEAGVADAALTAPTVHDSLRRLVSQLDRRSAHGSPAPLVASHGDFKYDQFLFDEPSGGFTLIDFELFCRAEPWLDLGTFLAYLPNSTPRDWREGAAAELLRTELVKTYERAMGEPVNLDRLVLYEAGMLGIRALSHVWARRGGWRERAGQLLELALERLINPTNAHSV